MSDPRAPKVLLVYPGSQAAGFVYPMGLLYIAYALRKINVEVTIFHMGVEQVNNLKMDDYLFVGISMLTGDMILNGLQVAKKIKDHNPNTPVVLGGVHPSLLVEQSLQHELVDMIVIGEGDETVKELAECLIAKRDLAGVKGLAYKSEDHQIKINEQREFINMDQLGFDLPYDLLGTWFTRAVAMPIHTSRGCPYRCGFCYNPALNKRSYRYKSWEKVVEEIEYLHNTYGMKNFNFDYEDEFFIYPERVYRIFKAIIAKGIKIHWSAFCRFNTFDKAMKDIGEDFIEVLKKSGCYYLSFGAESGSQRLLDNIIKKDITIEQIFRTVNQLKSFQISHRVSFICCFPSETLEDLNATFDVIDKISHENQFLLIGLFLLVPLPGTSICKVLTDQYSFKAPETLEAWGHYTMPMKSYKNVTWIPAAYAKMCFNLTRIATYPFYQDFLSYKNYRSFINNTSATYSINYHGYIFANIIRWRYKHRIFKYPMELMIFQAINSFENSMHILVKRYSPKFVFDILKKFFGKSNWVFKD